MNMGEEQDRMPRECMDVCCDWLSILGVLSTFLILIIVAKWIFAGEYNNNNNNNNKRMKTAAELAKEEAEHQRNLRRERFMRLYIRQ